MNACMIQIRTHTRTCTCTHTHTKERIGAAGAQRWKRLQSFHQQTACCHVRKQEIVCGVNNKVVQEADPGRLYVKPGCERLKTWPDKLYYIHIYASSFLIIFPHSSVLISRQHNYLIKRFML